MEISTILHNTYKAPTERLPVRICGKPNKTINWFEKTANESD